MVTVAALPVVEPEEPETLPVTLPVKAPMKELAVMEPSVVRLVLKEPLVLPKFTATSAAPKSAAAACSLGAVMAPAAMSTAPMVPFKMMVEVTEPVSVV